MLELVLLSLLGVVFIECVALITAYLTKQVGYFLSALPLSIILITALSFVWGEADSPQKVLFSFLAIVYAARLIGKFLLEVPRTHLEMSWVPSSVIKNIAHFFVPQALLTFIVSIPIIVINAKASGSLGVLGFCGAFLVIFGFVYEILSDLELERYLPTVLSKKTKDPRMVARVIFWFGFALGALLLPYGYFGLLSPVAVMIALHPRLMWGKGGILGLF